MPEASDLTVGIMPLFAEQEREAISRRTRQELSAAKARGVRLGNPNGAAALRRAGRGGQPLREAVARNADRHAEDLRAVVEDIRAGGSSSLRAIGSELDNRGILTRRGGRWHVSTVMNLLKRLSAATGWTAPSETSDSSPRRIAAALDRAVLDRPRRARTAALGSRPASRS